jgi:glycosyltransferase involved in cell wall biosynthesis
MRELLRDPGLARRLGEGARRIARERFDIRRFARDWDRAITLAAGRETTSAATASASTGGTA